MAPALEFRLAESLRSCSAIKAVTTESIIPSNTSLPLSSRIAGLVIKCPTFLTSINARPGNENEVPSGAK